MDEIILALLFGLGIFSLVGIGILRIGLKSRRETLRKAETERARASGTVVEIKREVRKSGYRAPNYTAYTPVVEFRAEGQTVRLDAMGSTQADEFVPGDSVEILYDPDDPTHFHIEGRDCEGKSSGNMIRFGLIWLACIVVAVIVIFALHPMQWRYLQNSLRRMPVLHPAEGNIRKDGEAGGLGYRLNDDGTVTIRSYTGSDESLTVPVLLDGHMVSGLETQAFSSSDSLKAVTVPGALRGVPAGAFAGCLGLREVTLGEGVTYVGPLAFSMCPALKSVALPASLAIIDASAFPEDCSALFYVTEGSPALRYCEEKGFRTEIAGTA